MSSEQMTTARRQKNQNRAMIGPEEDNHTTDEALEEVSGCNEGLFKADVSRIRNDNTLTKGPEQDDASRLPHVTPARNRPVYEGDVGATLGALHSLDQQILQADVGFAGQDGFHLPPCPASLALGLRAEGTPSLGGETAILAMEVRAATVVTNSVGWGGRVLVSGPT